MELLEQCRLWCKQGEGQKIIDALEAIPGENRTPEMDSELARAYNMIADGDRPECYEKALALLVPHEDYFQEDHCWNYRVGYAYYCLGQKLSLIHIFCATIRIGRSFKKISKQPSAFAVPQPPACSNNWRTAVSLNAIPVPPTLVSSRWSPHRKPRRCISRSNSASSMWNPSWQKACPRMKSIDS